MRHSHSINRVRRPQHGEAVVGDRLVTRRRESVDPKDIVLDRRAWVTAVEVGILASSAIEENTAPAVADKLISENPIPFQAVDTRITAVPASIEVNA